MHIVTVIGLLYLIGFSLLLDACRRAPLLEDHEK